MAERHGLRSHEPVILRSRLNVLVHLRPAPVVARVAGPIEAVRPGTAWQARELAIAAHLARAGAPVVAPSPLLPPGPHEHEGRVLSFWTYVQALDAPADPVAAGEALRFCHEVLLSYEGSLPVLSGVTEAEALLATLAAEEWIDRGVANQLLERILELGPLGWDAACLRLTRDGGERAEAALAASGITLDPGELALWVEARSLQVAVWRAYLATS